ncbi:hypothetical protein ACVW00_003365 [Marmoricola sp. URHA0025 HA25]
MTVTLFVLDVEDFRPLAEVAAKDRDVDVVKRGPYYEVSSDGVIEIDRDATGCRNAVWFSSVAAVRSGHVSQWDKAVLRITPGPSDAAVGPVSRSAVEKDLSSDLERDVT